MPVDESSHVQSSSPVQDHHQLVSPDPTSSTLGSGLSSTVPQLDPPVSPLAEQDAPPRIPRELLRCPVDHAHLPLASEPAPCTQRAAAGKAQTQRGSSKQKAKQLGSPSAVGQKTSAHLQLDAAVAVPNEPVHIYIDSAVCNAGDPLAGTPHLDNAEVDVQTPGLPNMPTPALGLPPDAVSAVASLPSSLLRSNSVKASPASTQVLKVLQEVPNSPQASTAEQHHGAALAQYQLFSDAGQRCLQPSSLTPWLQADRPDICQSTRGRMSLHGLASAPQCRLAHPSPGSLQAMQLIDSNKLSGRPHSCFAPCEPKHTGHRGLAAAASNYPTLDCGEEGRHLHTHVRQQNQVQALPGMLQHTEGARSTPYVEPGHLHHQPWAHQQQLRPVVTAPSQHYASAEPCQQHPNLQGHALPRTAYPVQPYASALESSWASSLQHAARLP
ncbi:hypothetical protein ABBQ38_004851 [Trebouxia sp. C0009 RCD-2024]